MGPPNRGWSAGVIAFCKRIAANALFHDAKRLFAAYAPYKFLGHRIETAVYHPWVIGFRRHPFMRDFWKFVDIDPELRARTLT